MNEEQMEMLSVKSAIERMVQNYINTYSTNGTPEGFFDAVERMVASFFVGQQIGNTYQIRSTPEGTLEISFSSGAHGTRVTFLLPEILQWRIKSPKASLAPLTVHEGDVRMSPLTDSIEVFRGKEWVSVGLEVLSDMAVDVTAPPTVDESGKDLDPIKAYERAKKADRNMV